jgi:hypothetical protein
MAVVGHPRTIAELAPPGSTGRQVASFAAIGVVSTAAYARSTPPPAGLDPAASTLALILTAIRNTAPTVASRSTSATGRGVPRQVGGPPWESPSRSPPARHRPRRPGAGRRAGGRAGVLVGANLLATICRFLLLHRWIAGPRQRAGGRTLEPSHEQHRRSSPASTAGVGTALGATRRRPDSRPRRRLAVPALAAWRAAILYLVNLTVSGYANTYYAMAAQAASQSWSAWFFGSLDASSFITLDKPPLATMVMGLAVRLFGLSSWSILLPEALMGVGAVAVLFLAVRRSFGTAAATIAGAVMALTPAAVLIFRYDNPDALLTLLLVSAAWALLRALDGGRLRWLALAGTLVGLGFMTKFLQAWLVLPVFALVWIVAAPGGWRRRLAGLAVSAAAVAVASLAWPLAVDLIPAASRPYIGGSTGNSVFDLILGYDGLGRIFGGAGNGGGGGGGGGMFGGSAGLFRLFNELFGGQVSWLFPYAVVAGVSGLVLRLRACAIAWSASSCQGGWRHVLINFVSRHHLRRDPPRAARSSAVAPSGCRASGRRSARMAGPGRSSPPEPGRVCSGRTPDCSRLRIVSSPDRG